jgi:hypothetical protein
MVAVKGSDDKLQGEYCRKCGQRVLRALTLTEEIGEDGPEAPQQQRAIPPEE